MEWNDLNHYVSFVVVVTLLIIIHQQSASAAIEIHPIVKANLSPLSNGPLSFYILKNIVVTDAINRNTKYGLTGGGPVDNGISINSVTGDAAFIGKLSVYKDTITELKPVAISLSAVNKTVDPKTNFTTIEYGGIGSHFFTDTYIPAIGKLVLTGKPETSTLLIQATH